ncbi:hypothetical protein JOM56_011833 [Amanita muscaria]
MVDSSNMALTKSLRHDLTTLLDDNFGYKGSFAHSENRPYAPSPLLTITGIGPISLPLSEIDAKRIIACATQAPFGLGTSTVIDKKNPTWDSFLQSNTANICSGLGLPGGYDIQYKLHKLLLYETGSHRSDHSRSEPGNSGQLQLSKGPLRELKWFRIQHATRQSDRLPLPSGPSLSARLFQHPATIN